MKVYKAISEVQAELAKVGIAKDRKNEQQRYYFRSVDDVYSALAPLLPKYGLCILPRMLAREVVERTNQKGTALFYVTVEAEFDFVAVEDGSKHIIRTFGEAMDSGDKATNKAMSAAYKYAAFQAFAIPTEGDNDADAVHSVQASVPISAAQCAELRKLIGESGATEEAFCDYLKCGTLPELPAGKFQNAKASLQQRIERQKGAK